MATTGLLFFHAFPLDHTMWEPQVARFGGTHSIVAIDFPAGAAATHPATMDGAADVAAEAVRAAGLDKVVVVGLSMGGYMALSFWRKYAGLVSGMVFANTRGDADDDAAKERRAVLAARLRAEGSDFLVAAPPPLLSAAAPGELLATVKQIIGSQTAETIAQEAEAMASRADSTPDLASINVPVLVITSDADTLIAPAITETMATAIPGARFETIAGAGHLSNLEAPDAFNDLLASFLEGLPKE